MTRRYSGCFLLAVAAGVAACSDKEQVPSAPLQQSVAATSLSCDFSTLQKLGNSYFAPPRQQTVRNLISSMAAQTAFNAETKRLGFGVMSQVDSVVSSGAGDAAVGSSLVNQLIACMYKPTAEAAAYPATFPEDFTIPLNPSLHGQFHVKPDSAGSAKAVLSRDTTAPFSGIAPSGVETWSSTLSGNPAPNLVLIYGLPGSAPTTYDWRTVPHGAQFSPAVVVGVCRDPTTETTSLLNEQNVGLLPFADAPFLDPATCSNMALLNPAGPSMFARGLIRLGASLFGPQALWATALSPGGLGGSTGGARSEFGPKAVPNVTLTFIRQPTNTSKNTTIAPPVTILATAVLAGGGSGGPVPNVSITVAAVNNNGTPAQLRGALTRVTDANGIATYDDLSVTKAGGYQLVTTAQVGGRPAIRVGAATSLRFNVAPK